MTLEQIEQEIYEYYQWFSKEAPLVTPSETGRLGELWGLFDRMVE